MVNSSPHLRPTSRQKVTVVFPGQTSTRQSSDCRVLNSFGGVLLVNKHPSVAPTEWILEEPPRADLRVGMHWDAPLVVNQHQTTPSTLRPISDFHVSTCVFVFGL